MKRTNRRELTAVEMLLEKEQKAERTDCERRVYRLLPTSMKRGIRCNCGEAYDDYAAYFPDILLPEVMICIEIDGGYHNYTAGYDGWRDNFFKLHGYEVLHIHNEDTKVPVAFWSLLIEKLRKCGSSGIIKEYIDDLQYLIDSEITYDFDDNDITSSLQNMSEMLGMADYKFNHNRIFAMKRKSFFKDYHSASKK